MLADRYYSIIKNTFYYSLLLIGLGLIFCMYMGYTAPLITLGIAKSADEWNMFIFEMIIKLTVAAIIIEIFYLPLYALVMKRIKFDHICSIIVIFISFNINSFGLSIKVSNTLFLLSSLWLVFRAFSIVSRFECLNSYVCDKRKISKLDDHNINCIYLLLFFIAIIVSLGKKEPIDITTLSFHEKCYIAFECLGIATFIISTLVFCNISLKNLHRPDQKITYHGGFNELVDYLFSFGVHLHKQIDNCFIFQRSFLLSPKVTIVVKKEDGLITLTGKDGIIGLLSEDLNKKEFTKE